MIKSQAVVDLEPKCPECGSSEVLEDQRAGVLVCTSCGLQLGGQLISEENEWRDFDDDGPRSHGVQANRVGGAEEGLFFMGLSTVMGAAAGDGSNSLARLQSKSTTLLNQKALLDAFRRVSRLAASLSLPQGIVDRSNELYAKVMEAQLFKAQKGDAVLIACIFFACRQEGVPRQMKEICQVAAQGDSKEDVVRAVKKAYKKMKAAKIGARQGARDLAASGGVGAVGGEGAAESKSGFASSAGASASSLVERYCSTLRLPLQLENAVRAVIDNAERACVLDGKAPATIAGAAIFLVSQLADPAGAVGPSGKPLDYKRTWEQIALVSLTAAVTLKKAYRALYAERNAIVPTSLAPPIRIAQLPLS